MAIKIYEQFAPFANPADGDHPYGSFKNDSIPGAEDGTPLDAVWANDYAGSDAELFAQAGIVPNGSADKLGASQRMDALHNIFDTYGTVAELMSGKFQVGKRVSVTDRANMVFLVQAGGTHNGYDIINADNGNTAVLDTQFEINASGVGLVSDGTSQNGVMVRIAEMITENPGARVVFNAGTYVMSAVQWNTLSNFELAFRGRVVFKLEDNTNVFSFRLSGCSNFRTTGTLLYDGNKANQTTGGSGAGAGNGTISFSGGCNNFSLDEVKGVDGWTNGIALDNCNDFRVNSLVADSTARRGVTLFNCSDFYITSINGDGSDLSNVCYVIGCSEFAIDHIHGKNSGGSNAILFEAGCSDFAAGSLIANDSYSGIKFELCERFAVDTCHSDTTTVSHGVTVNSCSDWEVGKAISWRSAGSGVAILNAEGNCRRGAFGSVNTGLNASDGVQIYTGNVYTIEKIQLGDVSSASNGGHAINNDGLGASPTLPLSGSVSASSLSVSGLAVGKFGVNAKVATDPARGGVSIGSGQYTTNYNTPITFSDGNISPTVNQLIGFNQIAKTANTTPTTITRFDGWSGDSKSFNILVTDSNTTFAAGAGVGGCVVFGGNQLAPAGSMWKATYADLKWYLHQLG